MLRLLLSRLPFGLLLAPVLALALPVENRVAAQGATSGERVTFDSFDSVGLRGTFYPGTKGNKSPCAILLHAFGENRSQGGWDELAKELQGKGLAVLAFDFRGHGDSLDVGASFWTERVNLTLKSAKSSRAKDKVNFRDFSQMDHYKMLVNDVAAAKRYLDTRNDSNDCNSANLVVIGAEQGAALGALWLAHSWRNSRTMRNAAGFQIPTGQMEGEDVACAIWLSISPSPTPNLNISQKPVTNWIRTAGREHKMPMLFLYGEKDARSAQYSKQLCESVLGAKKDSKNLKLTLHKSVDTKSAGRQLLEKPHKTQEWISEYVVKVLNERGNKPWTKREVSQTLPQRVNFEVIQ